MLNCIVELVLYYWRYTWC